MPPKNRKNKKIYKIKNKEINSAQALQYLRVCSRVCVCVSWDFVCGVRMLS